MLKFFGFILFIVLLNWVLGMLHVKNHISKSIGIAVLISLASTVMLWLSYQLTVDSGLEREIVVSNFITAFLVGEGAWIEDLQLALQNTIVCTLYFSIMFAFAFAVEKWSSKWLPVCENCNKRWAFLETLKTARGFNKGIKCPKCGKKQYLSKSARNRLSLLVLVNAPFIISTSFIDDMSPIHITIHAITMVFVYFSIYPLVVKVQSTDEKDAPMW